MPYNMISQCLELLKREDFKKEFKLIIYPILEVFLEGLQPYLFFILCFIVINFILTLSIFFYIIHIKYFLTL